MAVFLFLTDSDLKKKPTSINVFHTNKFDFRCTLELMQYKIKRMKISKSIKEQHMKGINYFFFYLSYDQIP